MRILRQRHCPGAHGVVVVAPARCVYTPPTGSGYRRADVSKWLPNHRTLDYAHASGFMGTLLQVPGHASSNSMSDALAAHPSTASLTAPATGRHIRPPAGSRTVGNTDIRSAIASQSCVVNLRNFEWMLRCTTGL